MKRHQNVQRFFSMVQVGGPGACWEWTGFKSYGYARFQADGEMMAYRWAYKRFVGEIPEGLELDHLCRNRACVWPRHLEAVTHAENTRRAKLGKTGPQTHCPHGHPYDEENTWIRRTPTGTARVCRTCKCARRHRDLGESVL